MDIKYKGIIHNVEGLVPFTGAMILAPTCKIKCKGCNSKDLKKEPDIISDSNTIISEICSIVSNKGIIFSGLEWSESPIELLELCRLASMKQLKIAIYTGLDYKDFNIAIAEGCPKDLREQYGDYFQYEDFKRFLGEAILSNLITTEFYIKTGNYDREFNATHTVFDIELPTANQKMYKIKAMEG